MYAVCDRNNRQVYAYYIIIIIMVAAVVVASRLPQSYPAEDRCGSLITEC